jgi:AcrR family transcriptional regulator
VSQDAIELRADEQSREGFYPNRDRKDEIVLALFEQIVRECTEEIRGAVESQSEPIERLRAFTIRLHESCPTSELSLLLAIDHPERVTAAVGPIVRMLRELLDDAVAGSVIEVTDTRRAAALIGQTVIYSWLGNRLVQNPRFRITSDEAWELCLRSLRDS